MFDILFRYQFSILRAAPALSRAEGNSPAPWRRSSALALPGGSFSNKTWLNLRYDVVLEEGNPTRRVGTGRLRARRRRTRGEHGSTKKRRRERAPTSSPPSSRLFARRTRSCARENEGLKLKIAKLEAGCKTPQEKEKEVKLPTEVWVIIAGKLDKNDVCSFALVSKQLREAQVLAGRELVTRPCKEDLVTLQTTLRRIGVRTGAGSSMRTHDLSSSEFSTSRLARATSKCLRSTGATCQRKGSVSCGTRILVVGHRQVLVAATWIWLSGCRRRVVNGEEEEEKKKRRTTPSRRRKKKIFFLGYY